MYLVFFWFVDLELIFCRQLAQTAPVYRLWTSTQTLSELSRQKPYVASYTDVRKSCLRLGIHSTSTTYLEKDIIRIVVYVTTRTECQDC